MFFPYSFSSHVHNWLYFSIRIQFRTFLRKKVITEQSSLYYTTLISRVIKVLNQFEKNNLIKTFSMKTKIILKIKLFKVILWQRRWIFLLHIILLYSLLIYKYLNRCLNHFKIKTYIRSFFYNVPVSLIL